MNNIILAGMPLCGKTTVSKELGELLHAPVLDTDEEIVKEHGNISEIFKSYGEEYFRNLESLAVKKVCKLKNTVISTGGGCLLRRENVAEFKKSGKIVYLRAELKTLTERAKGDKTRPLLFGNTEEKLKNLFYERAPVYENAADVAVDCDELTPGEIAIKITELLK